MQEITTYAEAIKVIRKGGVKVYGQIQGSSVALLLQKKDLLSIIKQRMDAGSTGPTDCDGHPGAWPYDEDCGSVYVDGSI